MTTAERRERARRGAIALNARLSPAQRKANARRAGKARLLRMTPQERIEVARLGGYAKADRGRTESPYVAELLRLDPPLPAEIARRLAILLRRS